PALARAWLGEELKLPNVATWWCGHDKERKFVLSDLDQLVIKRIDQPGRVIFGETLSRQELQQLADNIKAEPWAYVGQQHLSFSSVPTLAEGGLVPRQLVLRSFLAGDGEHYDVMPGGLSRVAGSAEVSVISGQKGGWSKDTWLLRSSGSMRDVLRLKPSGSRRFATAALTSRAAENLYWAASYLERSESLLRLVTAYRKRYDTWLDYGLENDERVLRQWVSLLHLYVPAELLGETPPAPDTLRRTLLANEIGTLTYNLRRGLEGIYTVRDLWPADNWLVIEELEELLSYAERNSDIVAIDQMVQPLLNAMMAFWGATQESLGLTQGGLWLHLGRRLERVQNMLLVISNFCQHLTPGQDAAAALESLLETHGCVISHRRRYGIELNFFTVWQHVLLEVTNPRSLLHQLQELESLLHYLNEGPQFGLTEQEKIE